MKLNKSIPKFDIHNPIHDFFDHGISPDEIKQHIVKALSPYFHSQKVLEENAINRLVSMWILFVRFSSSKDDLGSFEELIKITESAVAVDRSSTINVFPDYSTDLTKSVSKYWSFFNLENDKSDLELEDFAVELMKVIGQKLEAIGKIYLQLFVHISRIKKGRTPTKNQVQSQKLGNLINELEHEFTDKDFLSVNGIKLNQWRNIAYHHNYETIGNKVICTYKISGVANQIALTREELLQVGRRIYTIISIFKVAEVIFVYNNLTDIQNEFSSRGVTDLSMRAEAKFLDFYSALSTQGFKITNLEVEENKAVLDVEDLISDEEIQELQRQIHSSQFLYNLWVLTESEYLIVNYQQKGKTVFSSEVDSEVCRKIGDNEEEFKYLASKVIFNYKGQRIEK